MRCRSTWRGASCWEAAQPRTPHCITGGLHQIMMLGAFLGGPPRTFCPGSSVQSATAEVRLSVKTSNAALGSPRDLFVRRDLPLHTVGRLLLSTKEKIRSSCAVIKVSLVHQPLTMSAQSQISWHLNYRSQCRLDSLSNSVLGVLHY